MVWQQFLFFRYDDTMRQNFKEEPQDFDRNFAYSHACLLEKENFEYEKEYNGKTWLKEIFMMSQSRATVIGKIEMASVAMMCSGSYIVAEYVGTLLGVEYQLNIFALPA